jgi:hypothetical protein
MTLQITPDWQNGMNVRKRASNGSSHFPAMPLHIKKISDRQTRNAFIRLPWSLYRDDPMWVPPLLLERRQHLSPENPYFEHARCGFWIAYRDGMPVGRISAQIDQLHLERYRDGTGFWGMLEAEDDFHTFRELIRTAETWLQHQGMTHARGPFNLSINQECGLLVAGFDTPPSVMMGHARPYYQHHIEHCGYLKARDLLTYIIDWDFKPSAAMRMVTIRTRNRVQTRMLRKSHFQEELNLVQDIFNDAWSGNWGFVPFTQKEFEHLGRDLKLLVNDDLIRIAEVDGVPAAFMLVLPNLNEVIRDLNGRIFPFGWLKILWRLKVTCPRTARIPLMGVRSRFHDSLLGAALAYRLIGDIQETGARCGIQQLELSWILEDNTTMRNIIENIGGRVGKTYRIYERTF